MHMDCFSDYIIYIHNFFFYGDGCILIFFSLDCVQIKLWFQRFVELELTEKKSGHKI